MHSSSPPLRGIGVQSLVCDFDVALTPLEVTTEKKLWTRMMMMMVVVMMMMMILCLFDVGMRLRADTS